jgi:hypothetical protein
VTIIYNNKKAQYTIIQLLQIIGRPIHVKFYDGNNRLITMSLATADFPILNPGDNTTFTIRSELICLASERNYKLIPSTIDEYYGRFCRIHQSQLILK